MIVRDRHVHTVKYTHDTEAAFGLMRSYREFLHVSDGEMQDVIREHEDFAGRYYYSAEYGDFLDVSKCWLRPKGFDQTIILHDIDKLEYILFETYGYSCLICGAVHGCKEFGRIPHEMWESLSPRASAYGVRRVCRDCGNLMWHIGSGVDAGTAAIDALIARCLAHPLPLVYAPNRA